MCHVRPLVCQVGLGNWCLEGLGVLAPLTTLCGGPSFSKHFGGKGLVVAAHRVVMDTLRVRLGLIHGLTLFLGTIPQAYLLLMSLNVAKCNLGQVN